MGFEAMPRIADLEIAATWDEIELEAALRGRGALAAAEPSALSPSCLADALHALEALKELPKEERKRRAEELLRTLTSEPAEAEALESPDEPAAEAVDVSAPPSEEPVSAEPAAEAPPEEPLAPASDIAEPAAAEGASPAAPPVDAAPVPDSPAVVEAVTNSAETVDAAATEISPSEDVVMASADVSPEPESLPVPVCFADARLAIKAALEAAASGPPAADAALGAAAEPAAHPADPDDAIPKFLATACATIEPEQPDSLIPLRAVATAGALIGAVLLVYFWSSQEFGVAARPIIGAPAITAPAAAPKISASLAARQGFLASAPEFAAGPQAPRPRRPALVGFDLFDAPAPASAPVIAVKADLAPPSSPEETAALPPVPDSDIAALIKRGDDLLKGGDVAGARSAYERGAAQGNAKAQIGVGRTYDPLVLAKLGARGVRGDPVQAASWYARASEAGDDEGQQRLHALISGLSDCMLSQASCGSHKP